MITAASQASQLQDPTSEIRTPKSLDSTTPKQLEQVLDKADRLSKQLYALRNALVQRA